MVEKPVPVIDRAEFDHLVTQVAALQTAARPRKTQTVKVSSPAASVAAAPAGESADSARVVAESVAAVVPASVTLPNLATTVNNIIAALQAAGIMGA